MAPGRQETAFPTFSLQAVDSLCDHCGAQDYWDSIDLLGYTERPYVQDCWDSSDLRDDPCF